MIRTGLLKKNNMLEIVKVIKNSGPITKPDVVKLTGLASATVHNLVNELLDKKVVIEEGNADSSGGRKALLYRFNSRKYYVVGVNIGIKSTTAIVYDMDLNIIEKEQKKFELAAHSVEEGISFTTLLLKELFNKINVESEKILGIGISMPGPVNFRKGIVMKLTNAPRWRNVPIKEIIEGEFKIPTIVDNDSNSSVLCLKWMDAAREMKNAVYLSTNGGIGTGILINGSVYRGDHNIAGEIGHLSVDLNGKACNCGNVGCIELMASDQGMVDIAKTMLRNGSESIINVLCGNELDNLNMEIIVQAAKKQDEVAKNILQDTARYLSICISNIIKIYDPNEIIIDAAWLKEFTDIFNSIKNTVYESTEFINRDEVKIILNSVSEIFVLGAATLVLEHQFKSYENNKLIY